MATKFAKATKANKRLKMMLFGPAGVGKTTAAIQFPRPAVIDTEKGSVNDQYVDAINARGGGVIHTGDFDEMAASITNLIKEPEQYQTLIIDPFTVVYSDLLDKAAAKVGTDFGRHYGEADKRVRHLLRLLNRLDMNVVITCHSKIVYGENLTKLGNTFDGYKKLDFLFDLVIELEKRGKERVGIVRKSRIETFPDGDVFPFSYDAIADRYGREILERDAVAVELASHENVLELERLLGILNTPATVTEKWLDKADAETFAEMPQASIVACIEYLKAQVNKDQKVS